MDGKDMTLPLACSALRISAWRNALGAAAFNTSMTNTALVPRRDRRVTALRAVAARVAAVLGGLPRRGVRKRGAVCLVRARVRAPPRPLRLRAAPLSDPDVARLACSLTSFIAAA